MAFLLQAGSEVVPQDTEAAARPETMQFIDFEYSCYSFRGYDFGNHFDEYAGFECDYSRYPDKQAIAAFMRHYLRQQLGKDPVSPAYHQGFLLVRLGQCWHRLTAPRHHLLRICIAHHLLVIALLAGFKLSSTPG